MIIKGKLTDARIIHSRKSEVGDFAFVKVGDAEQILIRYGIQWQYVTQLALSGPKGWDWDGSKDAPTITPSIKCTHHDGQIFHGYLKAGHLEFLNDSTIRPNKEGST